VRIATRTACAAIAAALLAVVVFGLVARQQFGTASRRIIDRELENRAETAPLLAAVAERLSESELALTVQPTRVLAQGVTTELGPMPNGLLPAISDTGWSTASIGRQRWRAYTVEVSGVPNPGDKALVQVLEPLAGSDAVARRAWRTLLRFGLLTVLIAGAMGYVFGSLAARPLARLRRHASRLDARDRSTWSIGERYGAVEVDEVAAALDDGLRRLGDETERRDAALAAARGFATNAAHELRTPLQGAILNLGVALDDRSDPATRQELMGLALEQVQRMGASLSAVRALANAEVADDAWFEDLDLGELVDAVVAHEVRRFPAVEVELQVAEPANVRAWRDGVQLAVSNLVRNALVHGALPDGATHRLVVSVSGEGVMVDDNGAGVPRADRARVLRRFERGTGTTVGAGLGLSICHEVAQAHGGRVEVTESPLGGARVLLQLRPQGGQSGELS
jgi:two-component system sensor histidine kinase PrrB